MLACVLSCLLLLDIPDDITQKGRMDMTITTKQMIPKSSTVTFNCPCNYRRVIDKDYICWGVRCPMQGIHLIVDEEPIEFTDV